jgi:hypothetical protein
VWGAANARDRTDYGWEVYPEGLYEILQTFAREIGHRSIEVTENGAAYNTGPDASGRISDVKRVAFLRSHLRQVARAIKDGLPIESYYCWSLMDNFEGPPATHSASARRLPAELAARPLVRLIQPRRTYRSTASATPRPPPMHRLASPFFASRRSISCSSVTRIRQPEAPIG